MNTHASIHTRRLVALFLLMTGFFHSAWADNNGKGVQAITAYTGSALPANAFNPAKAFNKRLFRGTMNYSATPALPDGLSLNASTGSLSGTPTTAQTATPYTVTATGSIRGTASITISISVQAPFINSGLQTNYKATTGKRFTTSRGLKANGLGKKVNYTIDPPLPAGLNINPASGIISGSPATVQTPTNYTITAHGEGGGSATTSLNLEITSPPTRTGGKKTGNGDSDSESENGGAGGTTPGNTGSSPTNCMPATLTAAQEGRRAYMRLNCYSCHGAAGTGGMGPDIVNGEADDLQEVLSQGGEHGMPSYKGYLCPNDPSYLAAYLRALRNNPATAPKFLHWWEQNPSR